MDDRIYLPKAGLIRIIFSSLLVLIFWPFWGMVAGIAIYNTEIENFLEFLVYPIVLMIIGLIFYGLGGDKYRAEELMTPITFAGSTGFLLVITIIGQDQSSKVFNIGLNFKTLILCLVFIISAIGTSFFRVLIISEGHLYSDNLRKDSLYQKLHFFIILYCFMIIFLGLLTPGFMR